MSAVIEPLEALVSVSRQNGTSSTIEATVGPFNPITLNWCLGRTCADAPIDTAEPIAAATNSR